MTANVITYRGKSAMREIGKALNLPGDVMDRFSRLFAGGDFPHTLDLEEQVAQAGLADGHPRTGALLSLYPRLHGLPRHLGQHSGGMIIQAALFVWCIRAYLVANNGFSVGIGSFAVAPVFHASWLVLSVPFGLFTLLLPRTYTVAALSYGCIIPDALLWDWCVCRLYHFMRCYQQPRPT